MSAKQFAANRRNAQKSTGPKTAAGRAVSKMNAVKHGILSREVLVRGLNHCESSREFTALHRRFWEDWNPAGPTEEMLLDQIVTAHWRLRRVLAAEAGEAALSVDEGQWKRSRPHPQLQWMQWELLGDPIFEMQNSALGIGILETWLNEVRKAVEEGGDLSEATIQKLVDHFGGKPNSMTRELEKLRWQLQANPSGLDEAALKERNKREALAFLNRRIGTTMWCKSRCVEREQKEEEARQAAAILPSAVVVEKIQRYETKLQRHLYRAMAQLERLQRMRRGEVIPAPLSVALSEAG